ncbi:MAG: DoxX family membrane protein [Acidimicrobiales bacterium]
MSERSAAWSRVGVVMGVFVLFAGITHFTSPGFFNDIVPPWLPPSESFWTYVSGAAEIVIGLMLLVPSSRRRGALGAAWLFVLVYPANLYMTWDWRDRPAADQLVSWGRLPFQFLFIWLAVRVARAHDDRPPYPDGL